MYHQMSYFNLCLHL